MLQQLTIVYTQHVKYMYIYIYMCIYTYTHIIRRFHWFDTPVSNLGEPSRRHLASWWDHSRCTLGGTFCAFAAFERMSIFFENSEMWHIVCGQCWCYRGNDFYVLEGSRWDVQNKTPRSTQCSLWCFVSGSGSALMSCDIPFTCSSTNCVSRSMMRICPWVYRQIFFNG